jgi:hypothetical protein
LLLILWWVGTAANRGGPTLPIIALAVLWVLAAAIAFLAALSLYSPEHGSRVGFQSSRVAVRWNPAKSHILAYAAISYAMTIYMFSILFFLIGKNDNHAFTPAIETLSTAAYFSIVTIATVGYGDIQPVSGLARLMACAEILIGVAYTVFFFSVIAGFLRERDRP